MEDDGGLESKGSISARVTSNRRGGASRTSFLRVYPPSLEFVGVEFGPLYVLTVSVQNADTKVRRVRIKPPETKFFRLAYFPNTAVAPGLDAQFEIEFQATVEKDYHDKLFIYSDDEEIEVPLHAYVPAPNVQFDSFCDLGVVVMDNTITKYVEFANEGHRPGEVVIELDDANFTVSPTKFSLGPKGRFVDQDNDGRMEEDEWVEFPREQWTRRVRVEITGSEQGPVRAVAEVRVEGCNGTRLLDINAEVVDQRLELVPLGGGPAVETIPFGTVYFGEKRSVHSMLVNNGPQTISFSIQGEGAGAEEEEDAEKGGAKAPEAMTVRPLEGMIKPYSQVEVIAEFAPVLVPLAKGFTRRDGSEKKPQVFRRQMEIVCGDTKQNMPLLLSGSAAPPYVEVSERTLNFGECPVGERRDIAVRIKNMSEDLPVQFSLNKVAHFQTQAKGGVLQPLQSREIIFTYRPSQMGRFKNTLSLVLNNGISTVPIRVQGASSTVLPGSGRGSRVTRSGGGLPISERPKLNMTISRQRASKRVFVRPKPWDPGRPGAAVGARNDVEDFEGTADAAYTFSVAELQDQAAHRGKYTSFIASMRQQRLAAARAKELRRRGKSESSGILTVEDCGADLGMARRSGMSSPRLAIPEATDPLWLERPLDVTGKPKRGAGGSQLHRSFDPDRLVKRKFKTRPSTQAEMRDCSAALEPQDLKAVACGPKTISFGRVCVRSQTKKSFTVYNDLTSNVLVALKLDDVPELRATTPQSQVVPPGATAGFDICFSSTQEQKFRRTVQYVVNDSHAFKFNVDADVVPISIDFSKPEVNFGFAPDNLEPSVTELVTLTNPGNADTEVRWICRNPCFQVEPVSATIPAYDSLDVAVTYTPTLRGKSEDALELKISGGRSQKLLCRGVIEEARVSIKGTKAKQSAVVDFKEVAVGLAHQKNVTLRNPGKVSAIFWISCAVPGISCSPERGRILPGSTQELTVTLEADQPRLYEPSTSLIVLNVRCGQPRKLGVLAEAVVPKVSIQEEEFDFGEVAIGASVRQRLTLINTGNIPAAMVMDLAKYPEFSLTQAPTPTISGRPVTAMSIMTAIDSVVGGGEGQGTGHDGGSSPRGAHRFKLTVRPGAPLMMDLLYKPLQEAEHSFELPISLTGVDDVPDLRRAVIANGMSPKVVLSTSTVDFGETVVSRDRVKKVPHHLTFTITNASGVALEWEVDAAALKAVGKRAGFGTSNETFKIDPQREKLAPGATSKVRVTFLPDGAAVCRAVVPLYLDRDRSRPYLEMEVRGRGVFPRLEFDVEEVSLPPVPLGVASSQTFHILNAGYENLEVRYHLPKDNTRMPLSLEFPDGKTVSSSKKKIPVKVTFSSKKTLSFTARIDFLDEEGNRFAVYVSGMTDNCLLSNYEFVRSAQKRDAAAGSDRPWEFSATGPTAPVQFTRRAVGAGDAGSAAAASVGGGGSNSPGSPGRKGRKRMTRAQRVARGRGAAAAEAHAAEEAEKQRREAERRVWMDERRDFLLKWLNLNIFRNPIAEFPASIVAENGAPVLDMIESLCGKKLDGRIGPKFNSERKRDALDQLMRQYTSMLVLLKGFGGLLHLVKPEALLSKSLYGRYVLGKLQESGRVGADSAAPDAVAARKMAEREWKQLSEDAWTTVCLQTIKIFMLSRIHPRQYEALPGVANTDTSNDRAGVNSGSARSGGRGARGTGGTTKSNKRGGKKQKGKRGGVDPVLTQSNCYSAPENLLARWVALHFRNCNPDQEPRRVIKFDEDLKDGVLLCSVLLSHAPHLSSDQGGPMEELVLRPDAAGASPRTGEAGNSGGLSEQQAINMRSFFAGLEALAPEYMPTRDSMRNPNPRDMVLLLLSLYNALPNYIPKTTIEFSSVLGQSTTKQILLRNPSKKAMRYHAVLEGSQAFRVIGSNIHLDAHEQVAVPIEFSSRFSRPAKGRLVLRSQREGGVSAATLVFDLVSKVTDHRASKTIRVKCGAYEIQTLDIDVKNPFSKAGNFSITVLQERIDTGRGPGGRVGKSSNDMLPAGLKLPDTFIVGRKDVRLQAGAESKLGVTFCPLTSGEFSCKLIFLDEDAGEFVYEIIGTAGLPEALETVKFNTPIKPQCVRDIPVTKENRHFAKARDAMLELLPSRKRAAARDRLAQLEGRAKRFSVEVNSPFYSGPQDINLAADDDSGNSAPSARMNVVFCPKEPGIYPCRVVLRSSLLDVRVYEVRATVTANAVEKELEFVAPASKVVTQSIPIKNNTDEKWMLRATFTGSPAFEGPGSLLVPPKSTASYELTFSPSWVCSEEANLTLINQPTGDTFSFRLKGIGEEPLAEDHVVVHCQARDSLTKMFRVKNRSGSQVTFDVITDLPHVSGAPTITVGPNGSVDYVLAIHPQLGGTYSGSITFRNEEHDTFLWYTVEIVASSPDPEAEVPISAIVRKAVAVEISLENPTDEEVRFEVQLRGEGLIGDSQFRLAAGSEGAYELIFSPLVAGRQSGSVTFVDMDLGEFWYKLDLEAKPAPPVQLDTMACAVGAHCDQRVKLENPTGAELTLKGQSDNKINFSVVPPVVTLKPYGSTNVAVRYTPSTLDPSAEERASITFSNPTVGEWEYRVQGRGLPPSTAMAPFEVTALVGHSQSTSFMFRNPFPRPLTVACDMAFEPSKLGSFQLLVKRPKCVIPPFGNLQIPFMFAPLAITELRALVTLTAVDGATSFDGTPLRWEHPLHGIAEACPFSPKLTLRCRARQAVEQRFELRLPGLGPLKEPEKFKFEVKSSDENMILVKAALTITPLNERLFSPDEPLVYDARFEPLRAFREPAELVVTKASGGRWRFKLLMDVLEPEVDDVIIIQATLGSTSSVSFDLANIDGEQANFKAFMTPDSPFELQVHPNEGVLEPYGSTGTNFVVSFTPKDYGKILVGKLVIQTSEMMWSYEIRGTHPGYEKPPSPKGSLKMAGVLGAEESVKKKRVKKKRDRRDMRMKKVQKEAFKRGN